MKVTPVSSCSNGSSFPSTAHVVRTHGRETQGTTMTVLLTDHLKVSRQHWNDFVECSVRLTSSHLCVMYPQDNNNDSEIEPDVYMISVTDIIGCHLLDSQDTKALLPHHKSSKPTPNDKCSYFRVIAYPFKCPPKLFFNKTSRRMRKVLTLAVDKFDSQIENRDCAERWIKTLKWLKDEKRPITSDSYLESILVMDERRNKRLLVMVNPASGPGKAGSIFQDRVAPLLSEAGIDVTLFVSSSSGGATEYIRSADISHHFDGIVIISGDGLIFEVVNGLMSREDWIEAIKMPLGIIPGGSGNGLAFSINYAVGDTGTGNPILAATLNVIHGRRTPLDLVEVTTRHKTFYSFLSIGWGLLADMDIESERLRFMGGFRFTVYGIIRTFVLKKYRGRLSFLPVPALAKNYNPFSGVTRIQEYDGLTHTGQQAGLRMPELTDPVPDDWTVIDSDFIMVYTAHTSHMSSDCFLAPNARLDDGVIWLLYLTGNLSKSQVLSFLVSLESGKHADLPYCNLIPVRAFRLEPHHNIGVLTIDGERIETGPVQARVLPSIANVMSR